MALTSCLAVLLLGVEQYNEFFKVLRYTSGQISNFHFIKNTDYFADGHSLSPLLHTWSLGVEEQFYIMWPLLLVLAGKYLSQRSLLQTLIIITLISLCISEYLVRYDAMQSFYMIHSRAWQLALGGIASLHSVPSLKKRASINVASGIGIFFIIIGLIVIILFILSSNILKKHDDAPWRVSYNVDKTVYTPHELDRICSVDQGGYNLDKCIIGPNKDSYEVLLVGDCSCSTLFHSNI